MRKITSWILSIIDTKLLKFIIVGIVNTILGTIIMFGMYNFASFSYWISSATNYIITSILSFFLNKYFTFESKGLSFKQAFKFAINIALCYLLAYGIAKPVVLQLLFGQSENIQTNVAMLVGMVPFPPSN